MALENEYKDTCCKVEHSLSVGVIDEAFRKEFIKAIQTIYRVKKIEELAHRGTVREIYKTIYGGIKEGISMETNADTFVRENPAFTQQLKTNTWYFSAAKNRADLVGINNLLIDENGKFKPWRKFRADAEKILGRSARYLKTEYTTAVAGARMAAKWQRFMAQKDLYPYAKFFVVMDKHTSDICSPLHNVVMPWNHPLLQTHYPPNHFNCRTDVAATRYDKPTPEGKIKVPEIPSEFMTNIGATGQIFAKDSKYMTAMMKTFTKDEVDDFIYQVMSEEQSFIEWYRSEKTGGRIRVNLNADLRDLPNNLHLAKTIVDDHKADIDILPHFEGRKNPEYRIDGITGDGTHRDIEKETKPQNFIFNSLKKLKLKEQLGGYDKACLVMNFGKSESHSAKNIRRAVSELQEGFKKYDKLEFVILVANSKVWRIDRITALASTTADLRIKMSDFLNN